jgi:hypothetical protein
VKVRRPVEATLRGGGYGSRRDERARRPSQRAARSECGWARYRIDVPCRRRAYFGDRVEQLVRACRTFSGDLHRVADWLEATGITTVVYWIPVFEIRETRRGAAREALELRFARSIDLSFYPATMPLRDSRGYRIGVHSDSLSKALRPVGFLYDFEVFAPELTTTCQNIRGHTFSPKYAPLFSGLLGLFRSRLPPNVGE